MDIGGREARNQTVLHRFPNALFDRGDEVLGDRSAHDLVVEHKARAAIHGFDLDPTMSVLALASRLPFVLAFGFRLTTNRFAVGHFGVLGQDRDAKF